MLPNHITSALPVLDESEWWLPVVDWTGYEISDLGRVRSFKQNGGHWTLRIGPESRYTSEPRYLKGHVNEHGYVKVNLARNNGRFIKSKGVHVLVLEAFVGPRPTGYQACHNDGNPANNRLTNLRWGTVSANQVDRVRHGKYVCLRLKEADIPVIWARLVAGEWPSDVARNYGVDPAVIRHIRRRNSWSHITRDLPGQPVFRHRGRA